jgi:signal transduction histidine kinase
MLHYAKSAITKKLDKPQHMQPQTPTHQLERKVAILTRLSEVSTILNSTVQLDALLGHLMDAAAEIADAEAASVLLWNSITRELYFAATTTRSSDFHLIGQPVPMEGSIAGIAMRENRIVQVDDVSAEPVHYSKFDEQSEFQTRSVLAIPMNSRNKLIGVLEVVNHQQEGVWTEEDQHHLSILAAQAAVAIEVAQLVSALKKANYELSHLDKLKNDFIAIASHELRTPLGVILGYASFLKETTSDQVNEHATKVLSSALQLRRIIEDLTNLRYLKEGQAEIYFENTSLKEVMEDARRDVATLAEARMHYLTFEMPPDIPMLYIDRIRTNMAMTNILNNAMRFTPPGGRITVSAEVRNSEEVWISVKDTGIGIEEGELERIFHEFYQVEDHMTRANNGLGIGLSIARALIEAQHGRIWASSPGLGEGSTFTIALPLAQ